MDMATTVIIGSEGVTQYGETIMSSIVKSILTDAIDILNISKNK